MKPLYFRFWKFFSIDPMFLAEREMDSYFSLIEVDIREGSVCRESRIDAHTELAHHDFSFELHHIVIEFLESGREVGRGKYPSSLDHELEWSTV